MALQPHSRIESQLTDPTYKGPYLSRIELILKDYIANAGKIGFRGPYDSVEDLPDPGEEGYIYLVEPTDPESDDYDEYYYNSTDGKYHAMGSLRADLTNYYTKDEVNTLLLSKADLVNGKIPDEQIPESVHDILTYSSVEDLPEVGDPKKLYTVDKTTYQYKTNSTSTRFVNNRLVTDNTGGEETPVTIKLTFTEYNLPVVYSGMWYGVGCGDYSDLEEFQNPREIPGSIGINLVNAFQIINQNAPAVGDTIIINNYDGDLSIIYHSTLDDTDYDISSCIQTINYGEQGIPLTLNHEQYLISDSEQTFVFTNAAAGSLNIDLIINKSGYEVVGSDYSADIAAKQNTNLSTPIIVDGVQYTTVEDVLSALSNVSGAEFVQTLPSASADTIEKLYVLMTADSDPGLYVTTVNNNVYSWFKLSGSDVEEITASEADADFEAVFGSGTTGNPNLVTVSPTVFDSSDVTIVDP